MDLDNFTFFFINMIMSDWSFDNMNYFFYSQVTGNAALSTYED